MPGDPSIDKFHVGGTLGVGAGEVAGNQPDYVTYDPTSETNAYGITFTVPPAMSNTKQCLMIGCDPPDEGGSSHTYPIFILAFVAGGAAVADGAAAEVPVAEEDRRGRRRH
jgi:hypothetical protein